MRRHRSDTDMRFGARGLRRRFDRHVRSGQRGAEARRPPARPSRPETTRSAPCSRTAHGLTLYYFLPEKGGGDDGVRRHCLTTWPPVVVSGSPTAAVGRHRHAGRRSRSRFNGANGQRGRPTTAGRCTRTRGTAAPARPTVRTLDNTWFAAEPGTTLTRPAPHVGSRSDPAAGRNPVEHQHGRIWILTPHRCERLLTTSAANWDQIGPQIVTHLEIVAECIVLTSLIGLGLGIAATRSEPLSTFILAVTSTILTVPSFALFGLLSIWFGLANPPVIIGLVLYGLLPVTRNTRAGIKAVDPAVVRVRTRHGHELPAGPAARSSCRSRSRSSSAGSARPP